MDCEIVSNAATREAVLLVFALGIACLAVIAQQTEFFQRAVLWLRRDPLVRVLLVIGLFNAGSITLRSKNGAPSRSIQSTRTNDPIPSFVCHEARTNGVAMVEPTTNAVVSQACLLHGASEQGEWIESDAPFFFHWKFPRQHGHPTRCFAGEIVSAGEDCTAMNQASGMRRAEAPSPHA